MPAPVVVQALEALLGPAPGLQGAGSRGRTAPEGCGSEACFRGGLGGEQTRDSPRADPPGDTARRAAWAQRGALLSCLGPVPAPWAGGAEGCPPSLFRMEASYSRPSPAPRGCSRREAPTKAAACSARLCSAVLCRALRVAAVTATATVIALQRSDASVTT